MVQETLWSLLDLMKNTYCIGYTYCIRYWNNKMNNLNFDLIIYELADFVQVA